MKSRLRKWLITMLLNDSEVKAAIVKAINDDVRQNGRIRTLLMSQFDQHKGNDQAIMSTPFHYPRTIEK